MKNLIINTTFAVSHLISCECQDSNLGPPAYETDELTTALHRNILIKTFVAPPVPDFAFRITVSVSVF